MKTKKTDFFSTYHHGDEMAARWIAAVLKQARFSTLSDSWDFLPGEAPLEKIEYMFRVARDVMVLISPRFIQTLPRDSQTPGAFHLPPSSPRTGPPKEKMTVN
jgi:hypothetical protein